MWFERRLGELAEITSGGTPSRDVAEYWGGDIPWVTPTDITACKQNTLVATADRLTPKGLLNSSAKVLPAGSILFTSRATVGLSRIAGMAACTNQGFKSLSSFRGGIIGCGNFSYSTVAYYCNMNRTGCIRAAYDPVGDRAVSLCKKYGAVYASAQSVKLMFWHVWGFQWIDTI